MGKRCRLGEPEYVDDGEDCINVTFPDGETVRYERERTATRKVRVYGFTGTSQCSECERHIWRYDAFCKHCGARFTTTEYERV